MIFKKAVVILSLIATISAWNYCAEEGGYCYCEGPILYGAPTEDYSLDWEQNYYKVDTNGTGGADCDNSVFSDPLPGTEKACYCEFGE